MARISLPKDSKQAVAGGRVILMGILLLAGFLQIVWEAKAPAAAVLYAKNNTTAIENSSTVPIPPYVLPPDWKAPTYFSQQAPLSEFLERIKEQVEYKVDHNEEMIGGILTTSSYCRMASWIYPLPPLEVSSFGARFEECQSAPKAKILLDASQINQHNHVIFVPQLKVPHFVEHMLPQIRYDFVLWIGCYQLLPPQHARIEDRLWNVLVKHPRIVKVFATNLAVAAKDYQEVRQLASFPYGIKNQHDRVKNYRKSLGQPLPPNKTVDVHVGYLAKTNPLRTSIPSTDEWISPGQYYPQLAQAKVVLSPDGDRPDCYRHYEAIGLGAVPVTQLDRKYYGHFGDNVVYNNTNWSLEYLHDLAKQVKPPNRRLVFEEYWMEYMEQQAQRPLIFWSTLHQGRKFLSDMRKY